MEKKDFSKTTSLLLTGLISDGWMVVLITGRRKSGFDLISQEIPHTLAFIEHGGVVVTKNGTKELGSKQNHLKVEKYKNELLSSGYDIDDIGRNVTFRITGKQGNVLDQRDIEKLVANNLNVNYLVNEGRIDIVPTDVGKRLAMTWVKDHFQFGEIIEYAVGNDHNDLEMLAAADVSACPLTSERVVLDLIVGKSRGFVATKNSHEGIMEILSKFRSEDL